MSDNTEAYFREEQRFPGWILLLVILAGGSSVAAFVVGFYIQLVRGEPWGSKPMSNGALVAIGTLFILFGIGLIWLFASFKLVTEVHADALHIRFVPMRTRRIALSQIAAFEVRNFRPIREFGGWGIRYAKGVKAYLASGTEGVYLTMLDGRDVLVGSQNADELASVLRTWKRS